VVFQPTLFCGEKMFFFALSSHKIAKRRNTFLAEGFEDKGEYLAQFSKWCALFSCL